VEATLASATEPRQICRSALRLEPRSGIMRSMDFVAGVPIDCPNCGVGHLHAAVYIEAEGGDMYEVSERR
jgi:hypothetical protein